MATGTQGPDYLVNDTSVGSDFIDALGGDDTIQIRSSSRQQFVTASGGDGFDTLTYSGFVWGMSPGGLNIGQGTFSPRSEVRFSEIELLVINAIALSGPLSGGGVAPVYFTTGNTIDHLTIRSAERFGEPPGDVHVSTGGGDDSITLLSHVGRFSTVRAGSGNDLIDLTAALNGFFSAYGEDGDDTLLGSGGQDVLDGGAGDDFLRPGSNSDSFLIGDIVRGGDGNDVVYSGAKLGSSDSIDGGNGLDRLVLQGNYSAGLTLGNETVRGIETISMLSATDSTYSGAGTGLYDYVLTTRDTVFAAGVQARIEAGGLQAGEDLTFDGSAESDAHFIVYGGAGADRISTGAGNDTLSGGVGADTIVGGGGRDILLGSVDNDIFRFDSAGDSTAANQDYLRDFSLGDLIDLSRIDANALLAGDQAFSFIGSAAFGGHAGELRVQDQRAPIWLVQGDTNGDGAADFELLVVIVDRHIPGSGDFIL